MDKTEVMALLGGVLGRIAPEVDLAGVGDSEDLRTVLDLDSMDFLNLIIGLSKGAGVDIPEKDYPKFFTLKGILEYLA